MHCFSPNHVTAYFQESAKRARLSHQNRWQRALNSSALVVQSNPQVQTCSCEGGMPGGAAPGPWCGCRAQMSGGPWPSPHYPPPPAFTGQVRNNCLMEGNTFMQDRSQTEDPKTDRLHEYFRCRRFNCRLIALSMSSQIKSQITN